MIALVTCDIRLELTTYPLTFLCIEYFQKSETLFIFNQSTVTMLKHCHPVASEAHEQLEEPELSVSPPPLLPPRFELCTDTISLSSSSGSSSPTLSFIREMSLDLERKKSSLAAPFSSVHSFPPNSLLSTSWKFSPVSNRSASDSASHQAGLQGVSDFSL